MSPPAVSDLIFPEQANHNFSRTLGDLRRANLSIANRLRSIRQDAAFVEYVSGAYELPLVANERCGSWYVRPDLKAASAYFKSTDGHTGQWMFSTRRLNVHLLGLIGKENGCIIVDSTRRGKHAPDCHGLYVPPNAVSGSEKSQMEARIPSQVDSLLRLGLDLGLLRNGIQRPLRPFWITPADDAATAVATEVRALELFHPVVCCTSSRRVVGTEMSEAGYVQGAADDTENWALGLTAPLFWAHADELLATPDAALPDLISALVGTVAVAVNGEQAAAAAASSVRQLTSRLTVQPLPLLDSGLTATTASSPEMCLVCLGPVPTESDVWAKSGSQLEAGLGRHKMASRNLRKALPVVCDFVFRYLTAAASRSAQRQQEGGGDGRLPGALIACESGKDLSVGVALALDCWCFTADGALRTSPGGGDGGAGSFTKDAIRARLGRIMTAMPEANPSRATLQSVNSFLMDRPK